METIFLIPFVIVALYVVSRVIAAYLRVRDEGVRHSEELLRGGVTFGTLRTGKVPNRGTGALLAAREGLIMEASPEKLHVEGTRTIARDIF